ncbi:hypothetical protein Z969_10390 [Clostridium novyi A str. 4570]|uniref:Uncharacterized protein n=1 Tax=Clostridium novyi A str. 4570 TaxID=1444290 RepID=A0AA89CMK1_CLONO|nr:hypothetical protein [Clostridium novyi]KGM99776.1 hypothetical protein Z969_10390 [Clostridium novyi A str. 4570]
MKVPIIVFKTVNGFSASIVGLKYLYLCHETYEELKEVGEPIPTAEEMKKELIEDIGIQYLQDFYKIEFIDYTV